MERNCGEPRQRRITAEVHGAAEEHQRPTDLLSRGHVEQLHLRKDIYGYDALAWALYKNDRVDEAAQAMTQAMKLGTQDAMLFYHAGTIYQGLDDLRQARGYLKQALNLNPNFSVLHGELARQTLTALSDIEAAPGTLEAATR